MLHELDSVSLFARTREHLRLALLRENIQCLAQYRVRQKIKFCTAAFRSVVSCRRAIGERRVA